MDEENNVMENVGHVDSLKDKLRAVTNEIDSIKNSFSKGAEDLARIQSMLDIENLENISGIIERFEGQVAEAERKKVEAAEGAKKYSEELEKEKERLIKLWDAYKNQEEELSATEKKMTDYEERVRTAEVSKKQLEDDLTARTNTLTQKLEENESKIQQFDSYKQRCEEFDGIRNRLEEEMHSLRDEVNTKEDTINSLQKQVTALKEYENYSEYKSKYEEVSVQYEKEKGRLTKLYQLYEETDSECKKFKEETRSWQEWFDSNKDIFDRLFAAGPPTGSNHMPKETPTLAEMPVATTPTEKKSKGKSRKIRFKK